MPFSSVGAPVDARAICGMARAQVGADFCPAFGAAIQRRGPVWEFADRVQIQSPRSGRIENNWLADPVPVTVRHTSLSTTLRPAAPNRGQPEAATAGDR